MSTTNTLAEQLDAFPDPSVAVKETEVSVTLKKPGAFSVGKTLVSQVSEAEPPARKALMSGSVADVPPVASHSVVMFAGHAIPGAVVSSTVTVTVSVSQLAANLADWADALPAKPNATMANVAEPIIKFFNIDVSPICKSGCWGPRAQ